MPFAQQLRGLYNLIRTVTLSKPAFPQQLLSCISNYTKRARATPWGYTLRAGIVWICSLCVARVVPLQFARFPMPPPLNIPARHGLMAPSRDEVHARINRYLGNKTCRGCPDLFVVFAARVSPCILPRPAHCAPRQAWAHGVFHSVNMCYPHHSPPAKIVPFCRFALPLV